MKARKRALTAQIKPDTRNAIMDQLALAADEIIRLRSGLFEVADDLRHGQALMADVYAAYDALVESRRPFWHRLMWWRA